MTEFIAQVVRQGERYRVALIPVSYRGGSPIVAASWAERDFGIFEAISQGEAEAFIGQMSEQYWSLPAQPKSLELQLTQCKRCGISLPAGQVECDTFTSAKLRCEIGGDFPCNSCCGCRRMMNLGVATPARRIKSKAGR